MSKMPSLKPLIFIRQKGSHRIYIKEHNAVTVPYHNKDLRKGTLRSIIKQSGLSTEEFLKLLKN